ncbi:MAG: efflux RND transporter permease subunit [Terasakiella sp.]|uniref:efflux RND transporter permease subunit n=1 Tax=unclassified Terasakiella TaxID=2614952 RepID=UPI003B000F47
MTLSELSIRRPVLAIVSSLLIITAGIASVFSIPIRELPDVDTAVITITTYYTGASPKIVDTDITEVIESSISGVSGVKSIQSQSRRGRARTVIEFETGRDIDEAANDIRDAVGRIRSKLPDGVDEPAIVKSDSDADPVMRLAVVSDRHKPEEITDYVERYIIDHLSTLEGVASVDIRGERRYAIRVWLDRRAMAARNVTVSDIKNAIERNNIELPAGEIKSQNRLLELRLNARLSTPKQFENIILGKVNGYSVRLRDVAKIEQGVENDDLILRANGKPAVGLQVIRQSQANTMAISQLVRQKVESLKDNLPQGMEVIVGSDDALFISASIEEVITALIISLSLVVMVILLFLRSLRTTLIPVVTIPVALIGCLALIALFGFSINVLTLLALLLAIGLVVDDAIVVLENIKRRIDGGETPIVAAMRGTQQVTFAVLATSVTLVAVFIPISFLGGQVGRLFSEFGLIMVAAVAISTYVALSLCPMMASRLIKAPKKSEIADGIVDDDHLLAQSRIGRIYRNLLEKALQYPYFILAICLIFSLGAIGIYKELPRELAPREDRGVAFVPMTAPQGSTLSYTDEQAVQVERMLAPQVEKGNIRSVYTIIGWGNRPYRGFVVMRLAPWDERDQTQDQIVNSVRPKVKDLPGARASVSSPAGLGLRGNSTPLRIVVGGTDFDQVKQWANILLEQAKLNEGLVNPEMDYEENQPQLDIQFDRQRAYDLGIDAQEIATTLQVMFASKEISTYVDRGREYSVVAQIQPEDQKTYNSLENVFIRPDKSNPSALVPIGALVQATETAASAELRRYARLPSITIQAALAPDYTLGQAVNYMEEAARELLPLNAKIGYAGQSATFKDTSGGIQTVFILALVIVFLVLAAQFESFIHPLVIMLSVPLAIAGAVYTMMLAGLSLNVYSQIGILLLVGLMAKNGILIVEFANQLRDEGMNVRDAVKEAAILRFRPIIMTVISTILGAVPLVIATGAGAESRIAIGWVIVGGLGLALFLTLFLTPVLYSLLAGFSQPRSSVKKALEEELRQEEQAF